MKDESSWDYAYRMVPENPNFDIPLGRVLLIWAATIILLFLAGCTDPNAGKFPANKTQVLYQVRTIDGPLVLP